MEISTPLLPSIQRSYAQYDQQSCGLLKGGCSMKNLANASLSLF